MEFNYKSALEQGYHFLWVKHSKHNLFVNRYRIFHKERPGLSVVEVFTNAIFVESFLYDAIKKFIPEAWHLNLANDEIFSIDAIDPILLNSLNKDSIYGIQRKWVKLQKKEQNLKTWNFSKMPSKDVDLLDLQYRLVVPKHHKPDRRIHSCCFDYVTSGTFPKYESSILHLDWIIKSPVDRLIKLFKYEAIKSGAGLNRIKYYLPEIFDDTDHLWEGCTLEEQSLLNAWLDFHDVFKLTSQQ